MYLIFFLSFKLDCLFYCGDGERESYEGCDDGNVIDGDGCSSTCQVEQNWVCTGGSPTTADTCSCADVSNVYQFSSSCLTLNPEDQQAIDTTSSIAASTSVAAENTLIGAQIITGAARNI